MAVGCSPFGPCPQFELPSGLPAVGGLLFFYAAGSSTKQDTFTDSSGATPNTNPIVLDASGMPTNTQLWFTDGLPYKVVYAPAGDTDPPSSPLRTWDDLTGITNATITLDQWVPSGLVPTYINGTQFSLVGDQTSTFQVGRKLRTTLSGGTGYHAITASAFALGITTVTVDGTTLDAGLSAVSYGLLTSTNSSIPSVISLTTLTVSGTATIESLAVAKTATGSQTVATATPVTMFSSGGSGRSYLVVARCPAANYHAAGIVSQTAGGAVVMPLTSVGPLALSVSGTTDIQATQTSGGNLLIEWNYTRLS